MKILFKSFLFMWVILIFYLSSMTGEESVQVSGNVTEVVTGSTSLHDYIRVFAHFIEYFILSILFHINFKLCNVRVEYTLLVVLLVSFMDEVLQSMVPGRVFDLIDILIDNTGSVIGFIVINVIYKCLSK